MGAAASRCSTNPQDNLWRVVFFSKVAGSSSSFLLKKGSVESFALAIASNIFEQLE